MKAAAALAPAAGGSVPGRRASRFSSPTWLRLVGGAVVLLVLAFGAVATATVQDHADAVSDVVNRSEPLSVGAQEIYRSLSDADATATSAFLAAGPVPEDERVRYENDIAQATATISGATGVDDAGASGASLTLLASQLPVYTGLVSSARIDNLEQLQVGAAYQQEASQLMRARLLPAAQALYNAETAGLAADDGTADAVPLYAIVAGVAVLGVLIASQIALLRRTNRILNIGLGLATAAVLASFLWVGVAWFGERGPLDDARDHGSTPVEALSAARFAALQARSDESLMLIARDGEDKYSQDFDAEMGQLNGQGGLLAVALGSASIPQSAADVRTAIDYAQGWAGTNHTLRQEAEGAVPDKGYTDAVALATATTNPGTALDSAGIDRSLADAIQHQQAAFARSAGQAGDALSGVVAGISVLTIAAAISGALGIRTRLREYQ